MRFKQSPIRVHPGEQLGLFRFSSIPRVTPGTLIEIATDPGLSLSLLAPGGAGAERGWSRVSGSMRALVSAESGSQLSVFAAADGHDAELVMFVRRHHASGWVREIARKDEDSYVEAEFEPESGIVTVYEGRREFKALERAARQAGSPALVC